MTAIKLLAASALLVGTATSFTSNTTNSNSAVHRRLLQVGDTIPSYMTDLMLELKERKKLMEETPPEEIKYWFEYTGPLQVSHDSVELYALPVLARNWLARCGEMRITIIIHSSSEVQSHPLLDVYIPSESLSDCRNCFFGGSVVFNDCCFTQEWD